jgi:hypothetical protein
MTDAYPVSRGDVVRARRYGNRTRGTYVIDRVLENQHSEDCIAVEAHNEHSGQSGRYMILDLRGLKVMRSYA